MQTPTACDDAPQLQGYECVGDMLQNSVSCSSGGMREEIQGLMRTLSRGQEKGRESDELEKENKGRGLKG